MRGDGHADNPTAPARMNGHRTPPPGARAASAPWPVYPSRTHEAPDGRTPRPLSRARSTGCRRSAQPRSPCGGVVVLAGAAGGRRPGRRRGAGRHGGRRRRAARRLPRGAPVAHDRHGRRLHRPGPGQRRRPGVPGRHQRRRDELRPAPVPEGRRHRHVQRLQLVLRPHLAARATSPPGTKPSPARRPVWPAASTTAPVCTPCRTSRRSTAPTAPTTGSPTSAAFSPQLGGDPADTRLAASYGPPVTQPGLLHPRGGRDQVTKPPLQGRRYGQGAVHRHQRRRLDPAAGRHRAVGERLGRRAVDLVSREPISLEPGASRVIVRDAGALDQVGDWSRLDPGGAAGCREPRRQGDAFAFPVVLPRSWSCVAGPCASRACTRADPPQNCRYRNGLGLPSARRQAASSTPTTMA